MNNVLVLAALGFIATFVAIFLLAPIARRVGYIDAPGGRKTHQGLVLPIGGLAIFLVVALGTLLSDTSPNQGYFLAALTLLVVSGAVDEYFELGVITRVVVELCASLIMALGAGILLLQFGNLFGLGTIYLAFPVGLLFTAIAVFGTINAWNMIDGVDGLAATMAILSIASFLYISGSAELVTLYLILGGLFAFLCFNFSTGLGALPKVFLGDAGSKLIGFCFVWYLVRDTQAVNAEILPVTALYIMGLPIMDMTTTVVNRIRKGASPFTADRTHVHHILLAAGFSVRKTYAIIVAAALLLNLIGIVFHQYHIEAPLQFLVYAVFFIIYFGLVSVKKKTRTKSFNPIQNIG